MCIVRGIVFCGGVWGVGVYEWHDGGRSVGWLF